MPSSGTGWLAGRFLKMPLLIFFFHPLSACAQEELYGSIFLILQWKTTKTGYPELWRVVTGAILCVQALF